MRPAEANPFSPSARRVARPSAMAGESLSIRKASIPPMENARDRILEFLTATPGASTRMVARAMGMDDSSADYHLRRLLKERRLELDLHGRRVAWWPARCGYCPVLRRAIPAFRREGVAATAEALGEWPVAAPEIARRAGLPLALARASLHALLDAGLATRTQRGRTARAEGAATCIAKAAGQATCDLWGACPLSRHAAAGAS